MLYVSCRDSEGNAACPGMASHTRSSSKAFWSCAGADVLFVGKGADVGVTVSPIRINSLKEFGNLETVGEKLLGTEKAKVRP